MEVDGKEVIRVLERIAEKSTSLEEQIALGCAVSAVEKCDEPYWQTGTPTEEGEYLCKLLVAIDNKEIIRKSIETFMVSEDPEIGQFGGWLTDWEVLAWHRIED